MLRFTKVYEDRRTFSTNQELWTWMDNNKNPKYKFHPLKKGTESAWRIDVYENVSDVFLGYIEKD